MVFPMFRLFFPIVNRVKNSQFQVPVCAERVASCRPWLKPWPRTKKPFLVKKSVIFVETFVVSKLLKNYRFFELFVGSKWFRNMLAYHFLLIFDGSKLRFEDMLDLSFLFKMCFWLINQMIYIIWKAFDPQELGEISWKIMKWSCWRSGTRVASVQFMRFCKVRAKHGYNMIQWQCWDSTCP